ncbi:MAG: hypothetical protein QOD74_3095 [Variibacter sp.]|nr:hypothetical protein [Variibacter sp.]
MEVATRPTTGESLVSAVSWASIAAGAATACALSLFLMFVGAGIGLSSVSPWSHSGVSATTFKHATGIYLVVMAVMSSALGGYLAARCRTKWTGLHTNEVFFRDTAHGLFAWAFATLITATVLGAAAGTVVGGVSAGLGSSAPQAAAQAGGPSDLVVDKLLRPGDAASPPAQGGTSSPEGSRAELSRLLVASSRQGSDVSAADRAYMARVVSTRTGLPQAEAEKRVNDVLTEAKQTVDQARRSAAQLALWMAASLIFGAFAGALAAVEGGQHRDGVWEGRKLTPREL